MSESVCVCVCARSVECCQVTVSNKRKYPVSTKGFSKHFSLLFLVVALPPANLCQDILNNSILNSFKFERAPHT